MKIPKIEGGSWKVYIAGKCTGDPDYKAKFERVAAALGDQGFVVLNPATLPGGMSNAEYMRVCLAMIDTADAVLFLPDYKDSPGARLEFEYCSYIHKLAYLL